MNDRINNQLTSYRTRLNCLDLAAHKLIWLNKPPVAFTAKVALARTATQLLADTAGQQSASIAGSAADKAREEKELEDAAYTMARAVVACATDANDLTLAGKFDFPLSGWRRLRDEALLQKARLLETAAGALATGPTAANALTYGITPISVAAYKKEADDYALFIVAPQDASADRSALTANLPNLSRNAARIFDQLEDLLPQFKSAPGGPAFINAYLASSQIIDLGHGPATPPVPPVP